MLDDLFNGGESWRPVLAPVLEAQPDAAMFLGPATQASLVLRALSRFPRA